MTIEELKHRLFTSALERHKGNAEKAAWDLKVSSRTVYSFKAKQEEDKQNAEINEFLNKNIKQ
jgi:transcriptional regulator with PAS, ATPase and Fis domain